MAASGSMVDERGGVCAALPGAVKVRCGAAGTIATMSADAVPALVHVDDAIVVADKPAGLLSVPGRGEAGARCLSAWVQAELPDALIVHRLDMGTSGLVVFARGLPAQRALSLAFEQRRVMKRYVAVVAGLVEADEGRIDAPLAADWPARPRQKIDAENGKPSLTTWRVLARDAQRGTTRLALRPHTGRSHQLRVHLASIGHPILGDELYAREAVTAMSPRLLLHACHLGFLHPATREAVAFDSEVPF